MCFQTYLVSVVERRQIRYMDQWDGQSLFPNPEDYRRLRPQEPAARRIGRHGPAPALSISPGHYAVRVRLAAPLSLSEESRRRVAFTGQKVGEVPGWLAIVVAAQSPSQLP